MATKVAKTYKLYINGAFVRSESGRSRAIAHPKLKDTNIPAGSRKDFRDAVRAARTAWPGWASKTAYNRGQVVYRMAEVLESRRAEFIDLLGGGRAAAAEVTDSVALLVWYAGICDKITQVAGSVNQVAGPYLSVSIPESTGVVTVFAPDTPGLYGLVQHAAAALAGGNPVVAVTSERLPIAGLAFAEVIATSDVPAGVFNIISASRQELLSWVATHRDVNAIDVSGCTDEQRKLVEEKAAESVVRVVNWQGREPSPYLVSSFMEVKTTWHPVGV